MEENYEVKREEVQSRLRELGEYIKTQVPPGMGFTLLMFDYGEGGSMFYLSSADRPSMIVSMKEFLDKQSSETNPTSA